MVIKTVLLSGEERRAVIKWAEKPQAAQDGLEQELCS